MRSSLTTTLRTLVVAAALSPLLVPTVAVAGLQEGAMAYVRGDQAAALREFEPLAKEGMVEAINGIKFLAEDGYTPSFMVYGNLLESGKYGSPNLQEASNWYRKAADEKKRADEYAAAERKRLAEEAAAERKRAQEEAAARQREQSRLAKWRKTLQIGDDTHCGPIIEVRRPMFKVALIAQIQGFGNESWLKEQELFTPEYGCRNVNGRLSTH